MAILHKQYTGEVKDIDAESHTLTLTISTETQDRDGDIVRASGWMLDNYRKNPVVLFAHDYRQPPVAKTTKIGVEDKKLKATIEFAPTQRGNEMWTLYSKGFMRAASVGFQPLERKELPDEDEGEGKSIFGNFEFTKQELLEFSLVPVPSNVEALVSLMAKSVDSEPLAASGYVHVEGDVEPHRSDSGAITTFTSSTSDLIIYTTDATGTDIDKSAISYGSAHSGGTAKAPIEAPWNGPAQVRQAEGRAQLRRMHAWVNSEGDAEAKSSYKLPHHRANGTLIWRGTSAAGSATMGARGGVAIPGSDVAGVRAHLGRHYREFDRTPPWETEGNERAWYDEAKAVTLSDEMDYCAHLLDQRSRTGTEMTRDEAMLAEILMVRLDYAVSTERLIASNADDTGEQIQEDAGQSLSDADIAKLRALLNAQPDSASEDAPREDEPISVQEAAQGIIDALRAQNAA